LRFAAIFGRRSARPRVGPLIDLPLTACAGRRLAGIPSAGRRRLRRLDWRPSRRDGDALSPPRSRARSGGPRGLLVVSCAAQLATGRDSHSGFVPMCIMALPRETQRPGCPISRSLATSCVCLELRSLPSPGITRLQRYCEPLRHPKTPSLSLAGFRLVIPDHTLGLPVLRAPSLCTCLPPLPRCSGWA
jgi:hypothetical protein